MKHLYCPEGNEAIVPMQYVCIRSRFSNQKCVRMKATPGCGCKQSDWVMWLYPLLALAFEQYQKVGVKFSARLLIELAKSSNLGFSILLLFLSTLSSFFPHSNWFSFLCCCGCRSNSLANKAWKALLFGREVHLL